MPVAAGIGSDAMNIVKNADMKRGDNERAKAMAAS
jgi:hypothetical protein